MLFIKYTTFKSKNVHAFVRGHFSLAEEVGFEPTRAVKPCLVSSEVLSASQPLFLDYIMRL